MSANVKGKGKGRGKRTGLPVDKDEDNSQVVYDRALIYDIGVKICANQDYNPIREVWLF